MPTPKCPTCGVPARYVYCMQCGSEVRPYAVVQAETDLDETTEETEEDE